MTQIFAYLTFSGNCREAMTFYKECLGGVLSLQALGDSPMGNSMPDEMKQHILHGILKKDAMVLMGSDIVDENGMGRGNTVSLMLDCDTELEARVYYEKLSAGGNPTHKLQNTHWGSLFGDLTDRYGNQWLLNYSGT